MENEQTGVVKIHDVHIDQDYVQWLGDIKARYRNSQIKASVRVNAEQLRFNWQLGRDLVIRKAEERWGAGVVEQISLDLQAEFPESKGFSTTNLWYTKQWYRFYAENRQKLHQVGGEIQATDNQINKKLSQVGREIQESSLTMRDGVPFPAFFSLVPWRHHLEIVTKCSNKDKTEVQYAFETVQNPLGVASYTNIQIKEIQDQLPSIEELKERISQFSFNTAPSDTPC